MSIIWILALALLVLLLLLMLLLELLLELLLGLGRLLRLSLGHSSACVIGGHGAWQCVRVVCAAAGKVVLVPLGKRLLGPCFGSSTRNRRRTKAFDPVCAYIVSL